MEPVRIGILFSQTGIFAPTEAAHLKGAILGIDQVNRRGGIGGRPIDPIFYDPASNADLTRELGRKLIAEMKVASIFGCCTSVGRKALLPVVERHDSLLWYPTQFEGFEYSPNIIYGGTCPNQHTVPLAHYLLAQGRQRMFLIGSDYIFPRESNRIMREIFESMGGHVVGERYVGFEADRAALGIVVAAARDAKPDVIFSTVVGPQNVFLFHAYRDRELDIATSPIASISLTELETSMVAPEIFCGHIAATPYFGSISNVSNDRFAAMVRRHYGPAARPNRLMEASFLQIELFARAVERGARLETSDILASLEKVEIDAPQGPVRVDSENHYTYCWPRIAIAERDGGFRIVYEAKEPVRPDPYMVSYQ